MNGCSGCCRIALRRRTFNPVRIENSSATMSSSFFPQYMASFSSGGSIRPSFSMYTWIRERYLERPAIAAASLPPIPFGRSSNHCSRVMSRVLAAMTIAMSVHLCKTPLGAIMLHKTLCISEPLAVCFDVLISLYDFFPATTRARGDYFRFLYLRIGKSLSEAIKVHALYLPICAIIKRIGCFSFFPLCFERIFLFQGFQ